MAATATLILLLEWTLQAVSEAVAPLAWIN